MRRVSRVFIHSLHGSRPVLHGSSNFGLNSILTKLFLSAMLECSVLLGTLISDLQIGVRKRLRVRVLSSEHAHFENGRPPNLKRGLSSENSWS